MSDQWAGTEAADRAPEGIVGGELGEGLFVNQAFSVDMVFRNAMALVREQAALVIVGGFLMFLLQSMPSLLSLPFNFFFSLQSGTGEMDEVTAQGLTTGIQLLLALLFFPLQQLVTAGYVVAIGHWVAGDQVVWGALVKSVGAMVRALLYTIIVAFINIAIAVVLLGPVGLGIYGWFQGAVPGVAVGLIGFVLTVVWLAVTIYVSLGLQLGLFAAILDEDYPAEALRKSWSAASGARLTLFVTNFVWGIMIAVASFMVYCLVGLALLPIVQAMFLGGLAASWLAHARPDAKTREWPFFQRNPAPYT